MLVLIEEIFIVVVIDLVNGSNHKKCISLSNQKCMIQFILINLYLNEYIQEFQYYPFAVKLNSYVGNRNTLNYFSNKAFFQIKQKN